MLVIAAANLSQYARSRMLAAPNLASISDTETALKALQPRELTTGYADYWSACLITYLSGEQIIVAPGLPFSGARAPIATQPTQTLSIERNACLCWWIGIVPI